MKNTKLRPPMSFLLVIYIPVYLITSFIFYSTIGLSWPPTLLHYIIIVIWTILSILYIGYGYRNNYYVITKHELVQHKNNHILYYPYKDIIYLDTVYSEKKKFIHFVTSKGDERFIMHDKEKLIYKTLLDKTSDLITKDEVNHRFPKLKL